MPGEEISGAAADVKPAPVSRRETREARVSFGMDVADASDVGMVDARRLPLVRAIEEGEEDSPVPAVEAGPAARGSRRWLAVGLFLGACAVGFGVVWLLVR